MKRQQKQNVITGLKSNAAQAVSWLTGLPAIVSIV
jgi:hypothetical protein